MAETYNARSKPSYSADDLRSEFQAIQRQLRVSATSKLLGRTSAGAGPIEEITFEQSTWTPGISFGGGTTGITYTTQVGSYERIGRQVTVRGYILLSAKGSSTGTARITGLPHVVANSDALSSAAGALTPKAITFANQIGMRAEKNASAIVLYECTEAGVETVIDDTDFANTSQVLFSLTYATA